MHGITGVDHPVIAVRSLDAACLTFERLGFTLSGRGTHLEWGTGNSCIMFPEGYFELTGIIDSRRCTHNLESFLKVREGLVGVAFGTADAEVSFQSLVAAGIGLNPVQEVTRSLETPSGLREPRFKVCFLDKSETPGLPSTAICQHLTPGLIRDPAWLTHRNSAFRVISITVPVPKLDTAMQLYRKLFGRRVFRCARECAEVRIGRGATIRLVSGPGLGQLAVAVTDLGAVRKLLEESQLRFKSTAKDTVQVGAENACGLVVEFVEEET